MKKIAIMAVAMMGISSAVFAGTAPECSKQALDLAKMNLDAKAKAYGFSESHIVASSLKSEKPAANGLLAFSVGGEIYKGKYAIKVVLEDSNCGIVSLKIVDVSAQ
jgi:hypothetical protein